MEEKPRQAGRQQAGRGDWSHVEDINTKYYEYQGITKEQHCVVTIQDVTFWCQSGGHTRVI